MPFRPTAQYWPAQTRLLSASRCKELWLSNNEARNTNKPLSWHGQNLLQPVDVLTL